MKYLLDTHVLLWALADDPRLSAAQARAIGDGTLYLSSASLWEIGIKRALGKLQVPDGLADVALQSGCRPLPISWAHAERAAALPPHHADPFDRMLIAQAQAEGLVLLSADRKFDAYGVALIG
ncbi:MAG: type II toxin-antitoxin system VapC family toxin [Marinibacterium sp.]|nr:type II toxin-antitoxin system VapC family toxin [Marinibacterium sp.]